MGVKKGQTLKVGFSINRSFLPECAILYIQKGLDSAKVEGK